NESTGHGVVITTLADTTPPAEVTGLIRTYESNNVILNWTNPSDSDFSHVNIYKNGAILQENVMTQTYTDLGISTNVEYTYTVRTVDTKGNMSSGNTVTAMITSDTTPPDEVSNLAASTTTSTVTL